MKNNYQNILNNIQKEQELSKADKHDKIMISKDLSELGEILVNRFEAEDSMIEALHTSHQDQIAS